jgi:magnesium and cobalt transporter
VVVDEYGGISGLATIEDVLEQIVGNIDDEHDPEEVQPIQEMAEGRYQVMGLTRIESFNEFFGSELDDEEYETIGGLIMHELGRLPRRGEKLRFGEFEFQVSRADRRRIHTAEVSRPNSATEVVDG